MSSHQGKLVEVATPTIGGVTVRRHILDRETAALAELAQKLGRRLRTWMRRMPNMSVQRVVGRDETGRDITVDVIDDQDTLEDGTANPNKGSVLVLPWIPDSEWRETYELYGKTIMGLLKEQSTRAKLVLKNGAPPVSDEVFEASLRELAEKAIHEMPRAELEKLLEAKK